MFDKLYSRMPSLQMSLKTAFSAALATFMPVEKCHPQREISDNLGGEMGSGNTH